MVNYDSATCITCQPVPKQDWASPNLEEIL